MASPARVRSTAGVLVGVLVATLLVGAPAHGVTIDSQPTVVAELPPVTEPLVEAKAQVPNRAAPTQPVDAWEPSPVVWPEPSVTLVDLNAPTPTEPQDDAATAPVVVTRTGAEAAAQTPIVPDQEQAALSAPELPSSQDDPEGQDPQTTVAEGEPEVGPVVQVEVLDRAAAQEADVDGVVLNVGPAPDHAVAEPVEVAVSYAGFADAYGADWATRLQLVALPDCALDTPAQPECQARTLLDSVNDTDRQEVSATLAPESMGVLALTAQPSGSTGDWSATPLQPSATWQVSAQTGDFSWSYPMRVPPSQGGPTPELALTYSAGSIDGKVASANSQTSWVGEGWDLTSGFIERSYVPCSQDTTGGNNAGRKTGDLCWPTDNASLVFNGSASQLVKDATAPNTWRLKSDDGTRVERLTGANNSDNDGEYWKVTTVDGTQYFFGRGQRSASDTTALKSTWTVPVYGNQAGEPCHAAAFADSWCTQAWRWNLEYVVDTSGNTLTYFYETETNNYGRNLNTAVSSYVRGGYLSAITYGQRAGTETTTAPQRVSFTVEERCDPAATGIDCSPAGLTAATATAWPDVPFDLICTSTTSCPEVISPVFFTRKRLESVTTQVHSAGGYRDVDTWDLEQTYPTAGDGTTPQLWLAGIVHRGRAGGEVALPSVTFEGTQLANRVDTLGDLGPQMYRRRVTAVHTESGGVLSVNYTPADCSVSDLPAAPETNTRRCFPVKWVPRGSFTEPIQEYFHKYLVTSVVANGMDPASPATETHYDYRGAPAWHFDDNPLVPKDQRTWGQFRGYGEVDVITGAPTAPVRSHERYRYFRGMDGDHLPTGTRTAAVDGITDQDPLNGFVREQITFNGLNGPQLS